MSADNQVPTRGPRMTSSAMTDSAFRAFLYQRQQRRGLYPRAVLVGLLAGLLAIAFGEALEQLEHLRHSLILWAQQLPRWGWIFPVLFGAIGAALAVGMVRNFAPEAAGSGIPHLKAVILRPMAWQRIIAIKFLGGASAIGGGLALGREGPTVQMGGAVGAAVGRILKVTRRQRQTLIATGGGAGLAAAFIASVTADIAARSLTSQLPVFHILTYPIPSLAALPAFLILGILAGLLGVVFNRGLMSTLDLYARCGNWLARLGTWPANLAGGIVGAAIGLVGWFVQSALGGSRLLVDNALAGQIGLMMIPAWFALHFVLTMVRYGCGSPGGIFQARGPQDVLGKHDHPSQPS
jgi:chloride channel protein, CIC family